MNDQIEEFIKNFKEYCINFSQYDNLKSEEEKDNFIESAKTNIIDEIWPNTLR